MKSPLLFRARQRLANWLLNDVVLRKGLKFGSNTIDLSPSGVGDVIRWSGTQAALAAGDLGMDVSTGRPSAVIDDVVKALAHTDESGSLIKIESKLVTVATDTLLFSGLDGNTSKNYQIRGRIVNDGGGTAFIEMNPNGDPLSSTLKNVRHTFDSAAGHSVATATTPNVALINQGSEGQIIIDFMAKSGDRRLWTSNVAVRNSSSQVVWQQFVTLWNDTTNNVTSIELNSTQGTGFGVDTELTLYEITP